MPEDPEYLVPKTTLVLKNLPNAALKFLKKFFSPKIRYLDFFLRFLGVFVPVPNAKKWYFSNLAPVLKVKILQIF
jgi:hypothetical protein